MKRSIEHVAIFQRLLFSLRFHIIRARYEHNFSNGSHYGPFQWNPKLCFEFLFGRFFPWHFENWFRFCGWPCYCLYFRRFTAAAAAAALRPLLLKNPNGHKQRANVTFPESVPYYCEVPYAVFVFVSSNMLGYITDPGKRSMIWLLKHITSKKNTKNILSKSEIEKKPQQKKTRMKRSRRKKITNETRKFRK